MLYCCQGINYIVLDSENFFDRVCEALGIYNGLGAKTKVAKLLGISKTAVGLWEKGEMPGRNSLESIERISQLSNASLHWLLTGEGPKVISTRRSADADVPMTTAELKAMIRALIKEERKNAPPETSPFSLEDEAIIRKLPGIKGSELHRQKKSG